MAAIPRIAESVRVKVERSLRARAILVAFGLRRDGFSLILRSPRAPRSADAAHPRVSPRRSPCELRVRGIFVAF